MSGAMKARLALLKSSAAPAGGQKLAKINAWKSWAAASAMDVCDLLAWSLERLSDENDEAVHDGKTLRQLILEGAPACRFAVLGQRPLAILG
jgi:hypothetical protein